MKNNTTIEEFLLVVRSRYPNGLRFILYLFICITPFVETFSQTSRSAYVGDEVMFVVPSPPNNGSVYQSSWASQHTGVALKSSDTFSATFEIKSYFEGEATILCDYYYRALNPYTNTWVYNNARTYYSVSCKPVNIELKSSSMSLNVGESESIEYSLNPKTTITPTVTFVSSDNSVATVTNAGNVYAKAPGEAKITVRTNMGPETVVDVNVKSDKPTSVSLPSSLVLSVGESNTLSVIFTPSGTQSKLTWSSSNTNVATVNSSGEVTGVSVGNTSITVMTENGLSAMCKVIVSPLPETISIPSKVLIRYGDSRKLDVRFTPLEAYASISWLSSDVNVVSVSSNGYITAIGVGEADITATTSNGLSANCHVTVSLPNCYLILWTHAGEKMSFPIEEHPVISYEDGLISVKALWSTLTYPHTDVCKFTIGDMESTDETFIEFSPIIDDAKWNMQDNVIALSSCTPNEMVYVYDINGHLINEYSIGEDGSLRILISDFESGIYVMKMKSINYKFIKK